MPPLDPKLVVVVKTFKASLDALTAVGVPVAPIVTKMATECHASLVEMYESLLGLSSSK